MATSARVARALGRPELASAKIGFGFGAPSIQCAAGDTVVVLGLDLTGGGALVLPGNVTIAGCSGA